MISRLPRVIHDGKAYPTKTPVEEINTAEHGLLLDTVNRRWEGLKYGYVYLPSGVNDAYTAWQVTETGWSMHTLACDKAKKEGKPLPEWDGRILICLYNRAFVRPKSYTPYRANAFNSSSRAKQSERYRTNYGDDGTKFLSPTKGQMIRYLFPWELAWQDEAESAARVISAQGR